MVYGAPLFEQCGWELPIESVQAMLVVCGMRRAGGRTLQFDRGRAPEKGGYQEGGRFGGPPGGLVWDAP